MSDRIDSDEDRASLTDEELAAIEARHAEVMAGLKAHRKELSSLPGGPERTTGDERLADLREATKLRMKATAYEMRAGVMQGPIEILHLSAYAHACATGDDGAFFPTTMVGTGLQVRKGFELALEAARGFWSENENRAESPDYWARIEKAHEQLFRAAGVNGQRTAVLRLVRDSVDFWAGRGWLWETMKAAAGPERLKNENVIDGIRDSIIGYVLQELPLYDARFATLTIEGVRHLFSMTRPTSDVQSGGATNTAPPLLAARLAVMVNAFGDDDEAVSKKRFLAAEKAERSAQR